MYAIIQSGGKQYRVQPGDVIRVEKLDNALGSEFNFTEVLMVGGDASAVGSPLVPDALVTVVVTKQTKDRKIIIFKKKRRQGYRRFGTHRQPFTELFVKAISLNGKSMKADSDAKIIDVDQSRLDRITSKQEAKVADRQSKVGNKGAVSETKSAKPAKKVAAKKAAPKKAAGAKSATTKTVKKTAAKKTSKKA